MHTAIHVDLREQFIERLLRFINLTVTECEMELSKEEAKAERKKLKDALFTNDELLVWIGTRLGTQRIDQAVYHLLGKLAFRMT
jgi:hypothetical protein